MQNKFIVIAGPCVIESEKIVFAIADKLRNILADLPIDFYFKASFDKANRTSIESYRGPGIERGLKILGDIKKEI